MGTKGTHTLRSRTLLHPLRADLRLHKAGTRCGQLADIRSGEGLQKGGDELAIHGISTGRGLKAFRHKQIVEFHKVFPIVKQTVSAQGSHQQLAGQSIPREWRVEENLLDLGLALAFGYGSIPAQKMLERLFKFHHCIHRSRASEIELS